jgi:hypothetical protein
LFIQLTLHDESVSGRYVYEFGPWLFSLVIVQAIAMHRPSFLHRFASFTLLLALGTVPFMTLHSGGVYERLGAEQGVGNANPNAIAAWFGFCALYMTIKGYIEARPAYRLAAWIMAVGSLYAVSLTVSRGALIALAVSLVAASRRLLKVGLFPILLLAGLLFGLMELGVFDEAIRAYTLRGGEETGRLKVWPLLIEKFLSSPVIGLGASHTGTVTSDGLSRSPHNSFLLLAVASGIVPLVLFCAYLFRSGMAALRANASDPDFLFYLPLVIYTVMITSAGNMDFMTPWAIVCLAVPAVAGASRNDQCETSGPPIMSLRTEKTR